MSNQRLSHVLKAKLYENTEKFELMLEEINKFVELNPSLTKEERVLLNNGYKNIIANQRIAWRELIKTENSEKQKGSILKSEYCKELRLEVEEEILSSSEKILHMVNKYLIPNSSDIETKIFFYKMKADYLRYQAEVKVGDEYVSLYKKSMEAYVEGMKLAEELPIHNIVRLGIALNYSVLQYEVILNKEAAIEIAKTAYNDAMKIIDEIEKNKEILLLIQLLKENLSQWNNDNEENN